MHVNLDPQLVDKIANEVKSQGVFDQFRKDSMADVDTKPAYQNLRQRVENTVNKFLSEQKWTPELNKNQLREKLRKHITEAGFLDVGVERIVDQVVNPKIASVFQPKIEDIAYKYLGIPKPQPTIPTTDGPQLNGVLKIETDLLPTDLEQVSPDSDKGTTKSESKDEMDVDDKIDDFESPAFEPIETSNLSSAKCEIKPYQEDVKTEVISRNFEPQTFAFRKYPKLKEESSSEDWDVQEKVNKISTPIKAEEDCEPNVSGEATQESQLSQVSSDSRLSIVTNDNTQDEQSTACEIKEENNVNISEEAQMPKFNENSNSGLDKKSLEPLHFDIKKDEIKFEGTERKMESPNDTISPNTSDEHRLDSSLENKTLDNFETSDIPLPSHEFSFQKESDFKFSKIEVKVDLEDATKTTSLEDSADRELQIIEKSELSQCSMSQTSIKSPLSKMEKLPKSPSLTSSPAQLHKSSHRSKEHSSSSSRHKKYSKDKRSDRDRDRYSSHKLPSSSSSRYQSSKSSSSYRVSGSHSEHYHNHHHRSSSSSLHKSKGSSRNEKSSRSHHDSRSRDHSKSRSDKNKEKSSKEKSDRSKATDDHYSTKHKYRRSTDSNDDGDSSQDQSRNYGPKDNSSSQDNTSNGVLNNSTGSSGNSAANNSSGKVADKVENQTVNLSGQKIVILDNLLENPKTNFIEIGSSHIEVNTNPPNEVAPCSFDGTHLYHFEDGLQSKQQAAIERINLLTEEIENIRTTLHTYSEYPKQVSNTDSENSIQNKAERHACRAKTTSPDCSAIKRRLERSSISPPLTNATLTIDCIPYGNPSHLEKRFKFNETPPTKVSPTPSELSVNSKENEFVDKNAQSDSDSFGSRDASKSAVNKVTSAKRKSVINRNQRYSSEDLYKPRPILSQRSRRRGLDAVI